MPYTIEEIREKVLPIAMRYDVDGVSLFGSYARGEADEKSDIDLLLKKGRMRGLLQYCGMVADLEDEFQCHIDLVMESAIREDDFRNSVKKDEVKLYERV